MSGPQKCIYQQVDCWFWPVLIGTGKYKMDKPEERPIEKFLRLYERIFEEKKELKK